VVLAGVLAALAVGILTGSRLVDLDETVYRWAPERHWPQLSGLLDWWVLLGQRAVCLSLAAGWLGLRAWRTRDVRPLGVLLVATLLAQAGVGVMKNLVGRLGPLQLGPDAALPGGSDLFAAGGTIFPSGHTANAVVTWGVLALVARGHRRLGAVLAAGAALSVGLTTVYLGTHWISDVVAGWCAGGLVLLALPTAVPVAARAADRVRTQVAASSARRQQGSDRRQHGRGRLRSVRQVGGEQVAGQRRVDRGVPAGAGAGQHAHPVRAQQPVAVDDHRGHLEPGAGVPHGKCAAGRPQDPFHDRRPPVPTRLAGRLWSNRITGSGSWCFTPYTLVRPSARLEQTGRRTNGAPGRRRGPPTR
jgi:undecaprenyl-diphosphatase